MLERKFDKWFWVEKMHNPKIGDEIHVRRRGRRVYGTIESFSESEEIITVKLKNLIFNK